MAAAASTLWVAPGAGAQELRVSGVTPKPVAEGSATLVRHMDPAQMLRLTLTLQPPRQDELQQFLRDVQDHASPRFHRFLTFDQWKARYAPSDADIAKVSAWAEQHGLKVIHQFRNNLAIKVEGDAQTIERAFSVQLNHYTFGTRRFFSNDRDPVLPLELKGILKNVQGLDSYYRFHAAGQSQVEVDDDEPVYLPGPFIQRQSVQRSVEGSDQGRSPARTEKQAQPGHARVEPQICCGINSASIELPDLFTSQGYDLSALQRFSQCCNPFHDSGGSPVETSIAIIGIGSISSNGTNGDLDNFVSQYGMAYNLTQVQHNSPTCCNQEMTLDIESSTAMSNSFGSYLDTAHVYAYETGQNTTAGLLDSWNSAHSDDLARNASSSFGVPELGLSDSVAGSFAVTIDAMAAAGWTISVATGDHGATQDCTNNVFSVLFPASSPSVVAVGGTTLTLTNNSGQPQFKSEVAWNGPGCNGQPISSPSSNNGGGGGGCSNVFKTPPAYQDPSLVPGVNPCTTRALPDVALNAGTGEAIYYNGSWTGVGGTSIASPEFAGYMAQVNSYLLSLGNICGNYPFDQPCAPVGNPDTKIWLIGELGRAATGRNPFYDITSGSNGGDGTAGYFAGTGYDLATGWGSFNMLQLGWAFIDDVTHGVTPEVAFTGPAPNSWHNTDQQVKFTVSSPVSFGTTASVGIAGYTGQWDAVVADVSSHATPGSGDSFYNGPAKTGTGDFLSLSAAVAASGEGCHNAHVRAWDNAGETSDDQVYGPVCFDDKPPTDVCLPPDGLWHNTDVSIACTAFDQPNLSGLANPADAKFSLTTNVPAGTGTANASTNSHQVCDVAGNCVTAGPISGNMIDKVPPTYLCKPPDGLWHATDVSIACTAADQPGLSGLANPADASFALMTSVAAGVETNNAPTNSHQVCDVAGNCITAGPVSGNMVDKKPPSITIIVPTATSYIVNQAVAANYSCADGGSGVKTCAGPVASGSPINTASVGTKTFTVNATDNVGNASSQSVNYSVTYKVCLQYNPATPMPGRPALILLQICDYNGKNLSQKSIALTATAVDGNPALAKPLGNLNPGNVFLYGPPGATASYLYALDTTGLASGAHVLSFTVQGDPISHSAAFTLK